MGGGYTIVEEIRHMQARFNVGGRRLAKKESRQSCDGETKEGGNKRVCRVGC